MHFKELSCGKRDSLPPGEPQASGRPSLFLGTQPRLALASGLSVGIFLLTPGSLFFPGRMVTLYVSCPLLLGPRGVRMKLKSRPCLWEWWSERLEPPGLGPGGLVLRVRTGQRPRRRG